jgi:hypothetical protein|tara:strand:- start:372 stop:707 length:336 start_codon:yes stop_codon:yes gene_type:complete
MNRFEIILLAITILSLGASIFFFVFTRTILARLLFISEELGDLQDMIDNFAKHVQSVYELDSFYGDQTLQGLLEHAVSFNEQLETFEWIYALTAEEDQTQEEDFDDTKEDT